MLKKIAIVGHESTGKTTLAEMLAEHYQCTWIPEYARTYLSKLDKPYTQSDVEYIAKKQIEAEDEAVCRESTLLICDTNLLVIKIWMEDVYGQCPDWILKEIIKRKYDLYIITNPDIPWEFDPLRENPDRADYFHQLYLKAVSKSKSVVATGNASNRLNHMIHEVDKILNSNPKKGIG